MIITLWCLQAALIGFIGYNYIVNTLKLDKFAWHIVEIPYFILSGAAVALYSEYGSEWQNFGFNIQLLKAAITGGCMILLHVSWVNDALYYIWAAIYGFVVSCCKYVIGREEVGIAFKDWEGREAARYILLKAEKIPHASWTFAGWFGITDRRVILLQAVAAVAVVVVIIQLVL